MKKKVFILISVIVVLCAIVLFTKTVLAKYISVLQASGEAQIAKWSFQNSITIMERQLPILQYSYKTLIINRH